MPTAGCGLDSQSLNHPSAFEAIFRYPVNSMRGEPLDAATLGWPNENNAGIYGTVTRTGRLAVGQTIALHR